MRALGKPPVTKLGISLVSFASLIAITPVLCSTSCERRDNSFDGGATDALDDDSLNGTDVLNIGLSVDFTINCPGATDANADADGDAGVPTGCCRTTAPAELTFVPITGGAVNRYFWQFGDETASNLVTPTHIYRLPNQYDVTLVVGGSAGTLAETKRACVDVRPNPTGAACDVDVQCQAGNTCLCGAQSQCGSPFFRGLCSQSCRDADCAAPAVCADLSLGGAATPESPWRRPWCLAACEKTADCPVGTQCRDLPGRFPAGKWLKGCFPSFPLLTGSSCRNANGVLDSPSCVTGLCADVGAHGLCTNRCETSDCPASQTCTALASGEKVCLPRCKPNDSCNDDPWLACRTMPGLQASVTVCGPRECNVDSDCTNGRCVVSGPSGICRPR